MNTRLKSVGAVGIMLAAFLCMICLAERATARDAGAKGRTDFQRLGGRWVRPDGGYIIELRDIKKDGSVSAAYFNPMPIRVYHAELMKKKNGAIKLFMELRDVNYPGSTYNLVYDPVTDSLKGGYFQAAHKITYYVEFRRAG